MHPPPPPSQTNDNWWANSQLSIIPGQTTSFPNNTAAYTTVCNQNYVPPTGSYPVRGSLTASGLNIGEPGHVQGGLPGLNPFGMTILTLTHTCT